MVDGYCVNFDSSDLYSLDEGIDLENGPMVVINCQMILVLKMMMPYMRQQLILKLSLLGLGMRMSRGQGKVRLRQHQRIILGKVMILMT